MVARNAFILDEWRDKAKKEGREEGIKEGREEMQSTCIALKII
ncbi:hypothetical protein [Clostridium sp.]|nr:hypothetical protein [Clostridium sp.]MDR3594820.1 hypothetical protein [Clostridium sp.]